MMQATETELTADQMTVLEEIENTAYTESDAVAAEQFLSRFPYTATMLTAMAGALGELGDEQGALLLLAAAQAMAKHEAVTI